MRLLLLTADHTARDDYVCWATQELRSQSQALDAACQALEVSTWLSWHNRACSCLGGSLLPLVLHIASVFIAGSACRSQKGHSTLQSAC